MSRLERLRVTSNMSYLIPQFYIFTLIMALLIVSTDASIKSLLCLDCNNQDNVVELAKAYKTIEEYLVKNIHGKRDLSKIETVVLDWLEVMEEKKRKGSLVRALRLFSSMFQRYEKLEVACSWMYINILDRNLEIVQELAKVDNSLLSDILNQLGVKQAERCQMVYLNDFSEKYYRLYEENRELIRHIETFTAAIIGERLGTSKKPELYHLFTKQTFPIYKNMILKRELNKLEKNEVKLALDAIQSGDFGFSNQSDKLTTIELAEEYLIKPCRHFMRALHRDVFTLAEFGSQFSPTMMTKPYHLTASYYMAFASYRICKHLIIRRQDEIISMIDEEDTHVFRKKFLYE